ncbi:xanthine dehydrogenase [Haematobacter massiliensis]|uniref:Xanthine dehydrogenase n=1 Tax=Haematobacter massiliensis TaxID=195105 RepID=A0A086Y0Z1_9RHOB|nr:XdhC family protein [Haematobacter massiliensis]KFI27941.1 xanthine dehydrogenase [Haematobacter massiliensis]
MADAIFASARAEDPLAALSRVPEGALAIITHVEGPSYRPVGAMMAVSPDGARIGMLSSGCIDGDVALHAAEAMTDNQPRRLRYGAGSPFRDIELPCGGGLDILILPRPDRAVLARAVAAREARKTISLVVEPDGRLMEAPTGGASTGQEGDRFHLCLTPDLRFLVFGRGPEAATFAAFVRSAGWSIEAFSPDPESLLGSGAVVTTLARPTMPDVAVDPWTAIVLFFHDHDWEPEILKGALATDAFYIGALGSQRARRLRSARMRDLGVSEADIARARGPVGLIPSARDPRTLAASVLAEVLGEAQRIEF